MSDLQCPATLLLFTPEVAADSDTRAQRFALVIFAREIPAAEAAAVNIGAQHGCESRAADLASSTLIAQIAELADQYRGEQIAIIASAQTIRDTLRLPAPPAAAVAIAVDSDGWQFVSR